MRSCLASVLLVAAACGVSPVSGAPQAWLQFPGTSIKGESRYLGHEDWIEVIGFGVDSKRTISSGSGIPAVSSPQVGEIKLTKYLDRSSSDLFRAALGGTDPFPLVKLDLNTGGPSPVTRVELEGVLVSSQKLAASSGSDQAQEIIALNFTKITYYHVLPDTTTAYTSYDLVRQRAEGGIDGEPVEPDPDADKDGMADAWERANGLQVGVDDAAGDADGDGLSNLDEFLLGTNPRSGTSFFKATLTPIEGKPGACELSWNSVVGKTYLIEWSPDLIKPFTHVRTVSAASTTSTETIYHEGSAGFYRVRPE